MQGWLLSQSSLMNFIPLCGCPFHSLCVWTRGTCRLHRVCGSSETRLIVTDIAINCFESWSRLDQVFELWLYSVGCGGHGQSITNKINSYSPRLLVLRWLNNIQRNVASLSWILECVHHWHVTAQQWQARSRSGRRFDISCTLLMLYWDRVLLYHVVNSGQSNCSILGVYIT